jgi:hypothetical protein
MARRRYRGNTMALYAMFLVTVGVPILGLAVDMSRGWLYDVQLREATTAFCESYAHSIDIQYFRDNGLFKFRSDAYDTAAQNLARSSPLGAQVAVASKISGMGDNRVVTVWCTGTVWMNPILAIFSGPIKIVENATSKAKMGTTKNWK